VVNLDPANYTLPYPAAIDIKDLIGMEEVMETFQLGPNGGEHHRGAAATAAAAVNSRRMDRTRPAQLDAHLRSSDP